MTKQKKTCFTSIILFILKELRLERRLKQSDVAKKIGIQASGYCKIESGNSKLKFERFFSICDAFRVQPTDILAATETFSFHFRSKGWHVDMMSLPEGEDDLLIYSTNQGEGDFVPHSSILNTGRIHGRNEMPKALKDVFANPE